MKINIAGLKDELAKAEAWDRLVSLVEESEEWWPKYTSNRAKGNISRAVAEVGRVLIDEAAVKRNHPYDLWEAVHARLVKIRAARLQEQTDRMIERLFQ